MRNFVLALVAVVALAGCEQKGPTIAEIQLTGIYTLRTVNGSNLPFVLSGSGANMVEITASTLTLDSFGEYSDVGTIRTTQGGAVTTAPSPDAGTYSLTNGAIRFVSRVRPGSTLTGTPGTNTITIVSQGLTMVYQR